MQDEEQITVGLEVRKQGDVFSGEFTNMDTGEIISWEVTKGKDDQAWRLLFEAFPKQTLDAMFTTIKEDFDATDG